MTFLEWVLLLQLAALGVAGVVWVVLYFSTPKDSEDAIYLNLRTFWRVMLARHVVYDPIGPRKAAEDEEIEELHGHGPAMDLSEEEALAALARENEAEAEDSDETSAPRKPARKGGSTLPGRNAEVPSDVPVATLAVVVASNTGTEKIVGPQGEELKIAVKTAAEDASSNKVVLDLVAKAMGVRRYQVTLTRGHYHANKVIHIAGLTQAQLKRKLASLN